MSFRNKTQKSIINYPLIAVNAVIIGPVFIFFAIAAQVPASTIFSSDIKKCSFGFNLSPNDAQISVVMSGGIIILLFSISSLLALMNRNLEATTVASTGFAVMFVASVIIVSSLACRIPTDFFIDMMVVPFIIILAIILLHAYLERMRIKTNESD
ncbi:MAG: hypothetical protein ABJB76_03310 [Candidatus Nitrosocosmicus sp.]